jgi:hypothetical protein
MPLPRVSLQHALTLFIGGVGVAWYYVCLVVLGLQTSVDPSNAAFRDFMSLSLTTIGVALATFTGIILGFRAVSDEVREGVRQAGVGAAAIKLNAVATTVAGSFLQWAVAFLYVLSLLLALYFWWLFGDKAEPAIINLGKSLLGLVGGALSVLLNLPR